MSAHGGAIATSNMYAGNGCLRAVAKLASTAEMLRTTAVPEWSCESRFRVIGVNSVVSNELPQRVRNGP